MWRVRFDRLSANGVPRFDRLDAKGVPRCERLGADWVLRFDRLSVNGNEAGRKRPGLAADKPR